jgi:tetratricopeptide (TPR) repeat protein
VDYSKHIQKADEAARRRNYDFAIQLYQQVLEIDPDVGDARAGLRRVLRKRHEAKKSGLFGKLKGAGPLTVAKGLVKAGKYGASIKPFESYLETNPMDTEANLALGISLEAAGHFNSALAVFEFVAEIDPRNPHGLKRAGAMMAKTGEVVKALEYYERALQADPRDRDAIKARKDLAAEMALQGGRFDEVGHSREQVKDAGETRKLERSQRLHRTDEELAEELAELEERFAEDASDVETMLAMAKIHEKLKDPGAALDLAERALSYRKDSTEIASMVSRLKLKDLKKAIRRADKLGDQAEADRLEGQLQLLELDELRDQLLRHPGDANLRLTLGKALLRQGQTDDALAELQKAVSDPRLRREALFFLARCFHEKGFLDLARGEYEKALSEHPELDERAREILYNLGAIAEAEGNLADARSCYARIYAVDIGYRDVAKKMEQTS